MSLKGELQLTLLALALSANAFGGTGPERGFPVDTPVMGVRGAVTSANPLATQAGMQVLMQGGNAVDAAVATAAVLGVVEPQMSGLGAVGVLVLYLSETGEVRTLDFRGTVPLAVDLKRMNRDTKEYGVLAACVPGTVAGWAEVLEEYGTLSFARVLAPAIQYAKNGFPISYSLSQAIRDNEDLIRRFPTTALIFLPDGNIPRPGQRLVQKNLAATLEKVAAGGPEVFYRGEISDAFVRFSRENEGFFTKEDFARYKPRWMEAISTRYRGYEIHVAPPPAVGPTVLQTLNILEGFDLKSHGRYSAEVTHLFSEAAKLASSDEVKHIGDPSFSSVPVQRLISKEHAKEQRKRIRRDRAAVEVLPASIAETGGHTTALSVVDAAGNVVSLIQTNLRLFGAGVVFGDTGVIFNDQMRHGRANGPNEFEAGKIFRHPSVPIIVTREGKAVFSLGAAGASTIWQTLVQVIMNIVDYGMNIQEAISAPRVAITYAYDAMTDDLRYVENFTFGEIYAEESYLTADVKDELESRGHSIKVQEMIGWLHGVQIERQSGTIMGAADPRVDGQASAW